MDINNNIFDITPDAFTHDGDWLSDARKSPRTELGKEGGGKKMKRRLKRLEQEHERLMTDHEQLTIDCEQIKSALHTLVMQHERESNSWWRKLFTKAAPSLINVVGSLITRRGIPSVTVLPPRS
jgi:hypothetical protein